MAATSRDMAAARKEYKLQSRAGREEKGRESWEKAAFAAAASLLPTFLQISITAAKPWVHKRHLIHIHKHATSWPRRAEKGAAYACFS